MRHIHFFRRTSSTYSLLQTVRSKFAVVNISIRLRLLTTLRKDSFQEQFEKTIKHLPKVKVSSMRCVFSIFFALLMRLQQVSRNQKFQERYNFIGFFRQFLIFSKLILYTFKYFLTFKLPKSTSSFLFSFVAFRLFKPVKDCRSRGLYSSVELHWRILDSSSIRRYEAGSLPSKITKWTLFYQFLDVFVIDHQVIKSQKAENCYCFRDSSAEFPTSGKTRLFELTFTSKHPGCNSFCKVSGFENLQTIRVVQKLF